MIIDIRTSNLERERASLSIFVGLSTADVSCCGVRQHICVFVALKEIEIQERKPGGEKLRSLEVVFTIRALPQSGASY